MPRLDDLDSAISERERLEWLEQQVLRLPERMSCILRLKYGLFGSPQFSTEQLSSLYGVPDDFIEFAANRAVCELSNLAERADL